MKVNVRIIRPTRIEKGKAGDIIAVSPDRARFLIMYGLAEPVAIREQIETPEKRTVKKTAEAEKAEKTETPEKQTTGKTTRTAKAEPEKETKKAKAARKKA